MTMTVQEKEVIYDWAMDQEYQLTFYQVIKLLRIVEGMDESGPEAPICISMLPEKEKTPLWQAPYHLSTGSLMQLAQDRQLLDMGLIELCDNKEYLDTLDFQATTKGEMVAEWMLASLENLGFTHPSLISVNQPGSHLYRDDPS